MKNATESISNSRRVCKAEDQTVESPSQGTKDKKEQKKCERTCVNNGITFTGTTHTLLESQKQKRGRKGQRLYLKKQYQISSTSDEI